MTLLRACSRVRAIAVGALGPHHGTRSTNAVGTGASLARDAPTPARRHPARVPARARRACDAGASHGRRGLSLHRDARQRLRPADRPDPGGRDGRVDERGPQPAQRHGRRRCVRVGGSRARRGVRREVRDRGRLPVLLFDPRFARCRDDRPGAGRGRADPGSRVGRRTGSRDATVAPRRRDPCAAGRADDPGCGGRGRARRHRRDLARRLRRSRGRDDAVHHDPGSGSQPGDPGGRLRARQRDRGDRGRRRDDREHDGPPLPRERVPVVERVRLPRVVPDGVQRRRLRAVRVRLAVRAIRPLVRERASRLRLLHRPVLPLSRRDHRRARREQRRGIFGHERRRRPLRRELRMARQPRGHRAEHPGLRTARAAARRPDRRQLGARQQQRGCALVRPGVPVARDRDHRERRARQPRHAEPRRGPGGVRHRAPALSR